MVELIVSASDAGQRINKYVMKYLNAAPSSFVYKMLRKKNIVLNDKKANGDELLSCNDSVKLYLSDDTVAKFRKRLSDTVRQDGSEIKVLFLNDDIIAVHKPAGILSQKSAKDDYSINEGIIDYCRTKGLIDDDTLLTFKPSVCNRLDYNTSGIIFAGITLRGSRYLSEQFKTRGIDKYYYTIVKGKMTKKKHCTGYINKNHDKNISQVISVEEYERRGCNSKNPSDYTPIETEFIPLSSNDKYTLVKIKLITGKSHQIRAHLSHLGYPIIGDTKYGDRLSNKYFRDRYRLEFQLLHAGTCILNDETKIYDPLPDIFIRICEGEGIDYNEV